MSGGVPCGGSGGEDSAAAGAQVCPAVWVTRGSWGVCHTQPVHVGVEVGVANPQPGDGSVQGPTGGVGPPVVSCVLSDVS